MQATGAYAYVGAVEALSKGGHDFRIVGLSATPGKDAKKLQEVPLVERKCVKVVGDPASLL